MQENNKFNELETVKNVIEKNKNKGKSRADVYKSIVDDMFNIYLAKNNDYGNSFVKVREEFPSAICVRLSDKLERFKTLKKSKNQMVKDESIKDTLKDLANYAIMELVEIELSENVVNTDVTKIDSTKNNINFNDNEIKQLKLLIDNSDKILKLTRKNTIKLKNNKTTVTSLRLNEELLNIAKDYSKKNNITLTNIINTALTNFLIANSNRI